jgi:type II secretory pathway component PulF
MTKPSNSTIPRGKGRVSHLDISTFATDFRTLVAAGLPIGESLGLMARGYSGSAPPLSAALEDVRAAVERGRRLGEAFAPHRAVFGDLCVEMIAAGEQTGRLEEYLGEVAEDARVRYETRSSVVSALIEPITIVLVGLGVVLLLLTWTVPQMQQLYNALSKTGALPLPTRVLVAAANALGSPAGLLALLVLAGGLVGLAVAVRRHDGLRMATHELLLRVPILGDTVRKEAIARGCRTLGIAIRTIADVPTGLRMAAGTAGNMRVAEAFRAAGGMVRGGREIWTCLESTAVFPELCVWMVRSGERSGALDEMLLKLAEGYEIQVRIARERLLTLLRPVLLVVMGSLVLLVMLAMYLPIFTLIDQLRH